MTETDRRRPGEKEQDNSGKEQFESTELQCTEAHQVCSSQLESSAFAVRQLHVA